MCYITSTPETKYITNALPYQPKNATSKIYSSWPGAEAQNIMTISKTKEILTCPDQNALALYLQTSTLSTIYQIFNRKLATVYGSYLSNTKKFIKSSIVIAKTTLTDSNQQNIIVIIPFYIEPNFQGKSSIIINSSGYNF